MAKPWTNKDERFLRDYYPLNGARAVAEKLGRPYRAVIQRAVVLGIKRHPQAKSEMRAEIVRRLWEEGRYDREKAKREPNFKKKAAACNSVTTRTE